MSGSFAREGGDYPLPERKMHPVRLYSVDGGGTGEQRRSAGGELLTERKRCPMLLYSVGGGGTGEQRRSAGGELLHFCGGLVVGGDLLSDGGGVLVVQLLRAGDVRVLDHRGVVGAVVRVGQK